MNQAFARVTALIDAANELDPNKERNSNQDLVAKERLYSDRMTDCLARFAPEASDHLKIAARAQHIERWTSPRSNFPPGPAGYNQWRRDLARFHASRCAALMDESGYSSEDIERVKRLIMKRELKTNSECQTLEDVICLVFLEHYLGAFVQKHNRDKVISIIQKTWSKMSDQGHQTALSLSFPAQLNTLIQEALNND